MTLNGILGYLRDLSYEEWTVFADSLQETIIDAGGPEVEKFVITEALLQTIKDIRNE